MFIRESQLQQILRKLSLSICQIFNLCLSSQSVSMFFLICQALVFENDSPNSLQYVLFAALLIVVFSIASLFHTASLVIRIRSKILQRKETKDLASAVDMNKSSFMDKTGTQVNLHLAENPIHQSIHITTRGNETVSEHLELVDRPTARTRLDTSED
jgi:predicted membrane protein